MDISKVVEDAKDNLTNGMCGLDNFADDEMRIRGRDALTAAANKLTEIERYVKELQGGGA